MKTELESLANEVLLLNRIAGCQVDPNQIAAAESIRIAEDVYDGKWDGLLVCEPQTKKFLICLQEDRSERRKRFTTAHELGHYFIDSHRERIVAGNIHVSYSGRFSRDSMMEREADQFAAFLLMPTTYFSSADPTISSLQRMSAKFETSLEATLNRMVDETQSPCAAVYSKEGRVRYAKCSESLAYMGIHTVSAGMRIPTESRTEHFRTTGEIEKSKAMIQADRWFGSKVAKRGDWQLYEEVTSQGTYGEITILTYDP